MRHTFDEAFEKLIGHEGGFTKDRRDKGNWTGGRVGKGKLKGTKYGISAAAYPALDIENLTLEDAKEIYRTDYWDKVKCDDLPVGLDFLVFDIAVNHGVLDAALFLQEGIGAHVDGIIGPRTLRRANSRDVEESIKAVSTVRACDYASLKTVGIYGKGWYRRLVETTVQAIDMHRNALDQSKGEPEEVLGGLFRKVS